MGERAMHWWCRIFGHNWAVLYRFDGEQGEKCYRCKSRRTVNKLKDQPNG